MNLADSPLFYGVEDAVVEKIMNAGSTRVLKTEAGEELPGNAMYVLLSGSVQIEKQASDGRFVTMRVARAPETINVAVALSDETGESRLIVKTAGEAVAISGLTLRSAISEGGQLAINVTGFLTNRIQFLNKRIVSLAGYSTTNRVRMYFDEHREGQAVVLPMSLTAFAEYLGVGRASLYRALESMEDNGTIKRRGRKIEILT